MIESLIAAVGLIVASVVGRSRLPPGRALKPDAVAAQIELIRGLPTGTARRALELELERDLIRAIGRRRWAWRHLDLVQVTSLIPAGVGVGALIAIFVFMGDELASSEPSLWGLIPPALLACLAPLVIWVVNRRAVKAFDSDPVIQAVLPRIKELSAELAAVIESDRGRAGGVDADHSASPPLP
ncbi:MAG: hypothetical protein ACO1ON_13030 [Nocardioides sp.]